LRRTLLPGILLPLLAIVVVNTVSLYRQALRSAETACDRTMLASAKSIGELLGVSGRGDAALVDFYDDSYQGQPVRVAVLLQPVAGLDGRGMATIQVAEALELRQTRARQILIETFWRQAALVAQVAAVVVLAICADIADSLGGRISLDNRLHGGHVVGLDAPVRLPLADNGGQ
jgi:two-component system sensor histidine kinase TctE